MKKHNTRILIIALVGLIGLLWLSPAPTEACFSIVAGKDATVDGHVILAHNEDDGPPQVVNHYKAPRQRHAPREKVQLRNGGRLDQVEWTWSYLWSELPGMNFSDSYVNEWGVCITSDNCPSREDKPELTDGGIGYMLRRLVAERAKTASEGVKLLGELVERFGYIASGRTYLISDPEEGWLCCVVQGKHWMAQRVPDKEVAFVANTYTIREVNLSDSTNFLGSRDIISYAQARGWYDPTRDGAFDFAAAYASPGSAAHPSNLGRQWRGLEYLTAEPIRFGSKLPFSLVPQNKVKVTDLVEILRHARDASARETSVLEACPPEGSCRICSGRTQTSFVAQLRPDLPRDIGVVYWMCLAPPETSVFIPYYLGISEFPMGFVTDTQRPTRAVFDQRIAAPFRPDPLGAFWTFSCFRDKLLSASIDMRTQFLRRAQALENTALRQQKSIDAAVRTLYTRDKAAAQRLLNNFSNGLYMSALNAMTQSLEQEYDDERVLAREQAIHKAALTLDSHVDITRNYATAELDPGIDHPRLKCDLVKMGIGGVDGVFLAVFVGQSAELNAAGYARAQESAEAKFASIHRLTKTMHPDSCALALSADEVEPIVRSGKKAIIIGMENGYPLGEDIELLSYYYGLGTRYITLCHGHHNQICDSSRPETPLHGGLSALGKQVVTRMNELGIMCDASHVSEKSFFDLIEHTRAPILASHSGCAALHDHDRNLTDQQLRALRDNGGVIQIVALDSFLKAQTHARQQAVEQLQTDMGIPPRSEQRKMSAAQLEAIKPRVEAYYQRYREMAEQYPIATVKDYVDHIDHAVKVAGIDHVGIGTDFDGGGGIPGFNSHAEAFNVTKELLRRGYSDEDIKKIWGANLMRVWRRVEAVAKVGK